MKILFIGDLHLKPSQLTIAVGVLSWIREVIQVYTPDIVVYLGDTFDTHAIIRSEIQGIFYDHILASVSPLMETFHLVGNHDQWKPASSEYHALQTFRHIRNFRVVSEPEICMGIGFTPYISSASIFPKLETEILVAHQTFLGASYGSFRPKDGVDCTSLPNQLVISGHVHERQMFDNVLYPGTPLASSLNDVDQDKGLMLFDSDTFSYTFLDSPFPKYRSIEIREGDSTILNVNEKDKYIVKLIGSKAFCASFISSPDGRSLVGLGAVFRPQYTNSLKVQRVNIEKRSLKAMVNEYVDKVMQVEDKDSILDILEQFYDTQHG